MKKRFLLALLPVAVAVCTNPTALCGCEPMRTHLVVYGTVRTASGSVVADAQVFVALPPIETHATTPFFAPGMVTGPTAADGSYRVDALTYLSPPSQVSVVAAAVRAPADTARTTAAGGALRPQNDVPDSVRVGIVFP